MSVKRNHVAVLVVVTACIAGPLGFLGNRIGDGFTAIDAWLSDTGYQLWNEPIDRDWAVSKIAAVVLPLTMIAAGALALMLIWLLQRELRKAVTDHLPRSRIKRRTNKVARGNPTEALQRPKGTV